MWNDMFGVDELFRTLDNIFDSNTRYDRQTKILNERIDVGRMRLFDEILKKTGGRYLSNPYRSGEHYVVSYIPTKETLRLWNRLESDVVEVRRDQWYRKLFRRIFGQRN